MRKKIWVIVPVLLAMVACRTTKKVQTIQTAISKKDTVEVVTVKEKPKVDSAALVKNIMNKVKQHRIDFKTFTANIKVDYESASDARALKAYVYMQKDEVMYVRLVGSFLGITKEGFVAKITKDSVVLVNKIDKVVQYRSISYLQDVTQIPFDFRTLQDMLVGNPIFLDSNIVSYKSGEQQLSVYMVGLLFKNLLTLDASDYKILHSKLDDMDAMRNRTCDITYSSFQTALGQPFSTYRKISVAEKAKLDVWLDYKQYTFNEPITYTFSVPKGYKKK